MGVNDVLYELAKRETIDKLKWLLSLEKDDGMKELITKTIERLEK